MKQLLAVTIFILVVVGTAYAPDELKFAVYVAVQCDNGDIEASLASHIKRELRSLKDVLLVSENADNYENHYELRIVAVESTYKTGMKTGSVALAYFWAERFVHSPHYKHHISNESKKILESHYSSLIFISTMFGVITDDRENLASMCKSVVVSFDTYELERIRKIVRSSHEIGQKIMQEYNSR